MKIDHIRISRDRRRRHFSQAADHLNVTQSTVSGRIKSMEERFGRPLFEPV